MSWLEDLFGGNDGDDWDDKPAEEQQPPSDTDN